LLDPIAIKAVIAGYFAENVYEVEVINFGVENGEGDGKIESLLRLKIQSIPITATRSVRENLLPGEYELQKPSILLFDSPKNFNQTQPQIVFQRGIESHPHLVYVPNATVNEIQVVSYKNHTIDKSIFINVERDTIELATAFLFTPDACHSNQFKVINRFNRKKRVRELQVGTPFETFCKEEITFAPAMLSYEILQTYNSYIVLVDAQKILIPPGELYGDYEKMFLPFDAFSMDHNRIDNLRAFIGDPRHQMDFFGLP
jgi:hypothetical protein